MIKTVSQVLALGVTLAAMMEPADAQLPLPCWPYCGNSPWDQVCADDYGYGWYYCGPDGADYIWCCYA